MLTLLSPAKSLDFSPPETGVEPSEPRFGGDIESLIRRCKQLTTAELRELMSLSEPLAELNHQRFREMRWPFDADNAKPCLLAFQGDVYKGLEAGTLDDDQLRYAQDHIRILSGLYGVLRPLDLIQPYRLEMGTRLDTDRGKNLYQFWGERLVDSLNAEHAQRPVEAVLNLASNEYFKAVPAGKLEPRLVTAVFQEIRDGEPKTISFKAKRARGLMARFQVVHRVEDPEGLKAFDEEGYAYRPDLSTDDRLVFTREQA